MHRTHRAGALLGLTLVLAACGGGSPGPGASTGTSVDASASASGGGTPVEIASLSAAPSTEPSDAALPAFGCAFPVIGDGTVPRAQLIDVRVGTHDAYDRIVFEYDNGIPELQVTRAEPPLLEDGSGLPMDVAGEAFLQVVTQGGTKQTEAGGTSYPGPTELMPGFARLVELDEGGNFEAVNTWYVGMSGPACIRAYALNDPPRIVIDLEH